MKCSFKYKIDIDKSKFVLKGGKWEQVSEANEPVGSVLSLTKEDIDRLSSSSKAWLGEGNSILGTKEGFILATHLPCKQARETADVVRDVFQRVYLNKLNNGDVIQENMDHFIGIEEK